MTVELRRYILPVTPYSLPDLLRNPESVETDSLDIRVDFSEFQEQFSELRSQNEDAITPERAHWDRHLVEPLHHALRDMTRRMASDMRVWHWLCIGQLQDFVWFRWHGRVPDQITDDAMSRSLCERFLGNQTLRGVSRNALARLWWCGATLYSGVERYARACEALANQDFFQAIFEREFGLYPPAARACLRELADASEDERRAVTRRLNHYLTTVAVETLCEEDVRKLIRG